MSKVHTSVRKAGVRKAGTRMGQPHYSAECLTCRSVLAIGHLSKAAAQQRVAQHITDRH